VKEVNSTQTRSASKCNVFGSRGPEVNIKTCQANGFGQYSLVLIASARARELARRNNFKVAHGGDPFEHRGSFAVTALKDIEANAIDAKFYLENFIELNRSFPTRKSMQAIGEK